MSIVTGYALLTAPDLTGELGAGATAVWSGENVVEVDGQTYGLRGQSATLTITTDEITPSDTKLTIKDGKGTALEVTKLTGIKALVGGNAPVYSSTDKTLTFGEGTYTAGTIVVELPAVSATIAYNVVTATWA